MLAIVIGLVVIGMGIKGLTPAGIPLTREKQIRGFWAKVAGGFCIALGVLMLADGAWSLMEFGKKVAGPANPQAAPPAPVPPIPPKEIEPVAKQSEATEPATSEPPPKKPVAIEPAPETPGWVRFKSADAAFSVLLPGKPNEINTGANPQIGKVAGRAFQLQDGERFYQIVFTQFLMPTSDLEAELNAGRDNALRAIEGKMRTERNLKMAGFPARDIVIEAPTGEVMRVAIIVADKNFYQIWASGPKGFVDSDLINQYYKSFELKLPATGAEGAEGAVPANKPTPPAE